MSSGAANYSKKVPNKGKRKSKKRTKNAVLIICVTSIVVLVTVLGVSYGVGRAYYKDKFLADTYINGVEVSGMTYEEAVDALKAEELPETLTITAIDGKQFVLSPRDFGYRRSAKTEIKRLFDNVDHAIWFKGYAGRSDLKFTDEVTYDAALLDGLLAQQDWGSTPTSDASLELTDSGYVINKEVQGTEVTDMSQLEYAVQSALNKGEFEVRLDETTGCYDIPKIKSETFEDQCEALNKVFNMSITYDFDYTTETITGNTLLSLIIMDDMGNYVVDEDAVEEYVEGLAEKYDTYKTVRKFKSTLQGEVEVDPGDDGLYGWWLWKDETTKQLIGLLEDGESVESIDPIYYNTGNYYYTGLESARSEKDDIGKTYVEIDLTNQQLWYYKDGKEEYTCYIVSGQTTSQARTTLEGVYKLWDKQTNFRMKSSNADGEEWDVTCNYWNNVSICGIGLHDSTWRGAFGGTIYKWNGSHGCINMPLAGAKYIFDNVEYGTPVVMFYS